MATKWKIVHDRPGCIGCGACAAACPKFWKMSDADGKSDLIGGKAVGDKFELEVVADVGCNKAAADGCPVNVIHLVDETGKQII